MHKVLIFGDRNWTDTQAIRGLLRKLQLKHHDRLIIINGGAPGADIIADYTAKELSIHTARVDALWETRHRAAGPQRNEIMALLEPDEAFGFHPDITKSKGSKDMKKRCERHGIPVRILS